MILSHKHQFIFIKTRKTAGTSLEIALSAFCGDRDVITPVDEEDEAARKSLGFTSAQHYKLPWSVHTFREKVACVFGKDRKQFYNHISSEEAKANMPKNIWEEYFSFCFERNPWDKVLSQYNARGGDEHFGSVMNYLTTGEVVRLRGYDMYSVRRIVAVDQVYKFEEMDQALADITERLRLDKPLKMPSYRAKGNRRKDNRHYREVLSLEESELIAQIFAREIKLLDYTF